MDFALMLIGSFLTGFGIGGHVAASVCRRNRDSSGRFVREPWIERHWGDVCWTMAVLGLCVVLVSVSIVVRM